MQKVELYPDTQKYMDLFYEPQITAYEFLKVFFAELYKKNVNEISRDLAEFLYTVKNDPKYKEVLREVKFRSNGIFRYSNELEDNIFTLQNMGLLGKENPSFGRILIKYNDEVSDEIIRSTSHEYVELISEIADKYIAGSPRK